MNKSEAKTVLRYPGGKQRAVKILSEYIPPDESEICSPFLGGGSFELYCVSVLGIPVYGYDNFLPLVEFWQTLLFRRELLAEKSAEFLPVLKRDDFYELQKTQATLPAKLERAAAFYVINRASFSGCTLSGGMSPGHPRFTPSAVERVRRFPSAKIKPFFSADKMDFADSIASHKRGLIYADPPYILKNQNLYGARGNGHRGFEHEKLRDILLARGGRWLLSYNDCKYARRLYKGHAMLTPRWRYGMSNDKNSRELLVLSDELSQTLSDFRGRRVAA
ncbi:MAG: DNA adenine methylase [Gammaproteobacteria bacterium]